MTGSIPSSIIVALGLLFVLVVILIILVKNLRQTLRSFMAGKDGASLESTLAWLTHKAAATDETLEAHKEGLEHIDARVKRSIRGYSLVRYDAYESSGGEQSFASGLLDEHGDGYILSVISNRSHVGVYAKKVNRGIPEVSLTKEETIALTDAKKQLS
jgi:hypothetical protein